MRKKLNFKVSIPTKLVASVILMIISLLLLMSVTVAWFTLSTTPEVDGMRITIAGNNTIMIAPNQTKTTDDRIIVNYPGKFTKVGNLQTPETALLSPVSTADGVNWFIPNITQDGQMDVENFSDFTLDNNLTYGNTENGGYVYVDFWLVSPLNDCYIRLSTGDLDKSKDDSQIGSYLIQLPETKKDRLRESDYVLDDSNQTLSSSARVGFLVNTEYVTTNEEMNAYIDSSHYVDDYKKLKGIYGGNEDDYSFIIYEPNGLIHNNDGLSVQLTDTGLESVLVKNGEYHITRPIGFDEQGRVTNVNIAQNLIVQTKSQWIKDDKNEMLLNMLYQNYLLDDSIYKESEDASLYYSYIDYNFLQYVDAGHLFESTWDLYMHQEDNIVNEDSLSILMQNNVVIDSHLVVLEKNVPQRIRMFVWIEGQDVDCNLNTSGQSIALRLELAGSTGE